jgi:single-strand DNA-binding protein
MAQLIGLMRLGQDGELRYTPQGDAVLSLSLAYNYGRKDESGQQQTQWVRASLWGKRAESVAQYMLKGSAVVAYIGDLHNRQWEKDGKAGVSLEGRLEHFEFAGGSNSGGKPQTTDQRQAPQQQASHAPQQADPFGDDVPF